MASNLLLIALVVRNIYTRGAIVMKKIVSWVFVVVMAFSVIFSGSVMSAEAQSMSGTVRATKRKSVRGGRYVAHKTKRGTKWTFHKTKRGTKYTAHKVKRGTKWTYHKTKRGTKYTAHKTKRGTKSVFHKTKKVITQ